MKLEEIDYNDYINCGESFITFSDFNILTDEKPFNLNILKQNAIIFCKTDYIDFLFENIRFSSRKYILITHYSDYPINEYRFSRKPNCIKKWYAYCITYNHPNIHHIPAGVTPRWLPPPYKIDKEYDNWFKVNSKKLSKKKKNDEIVYCNYGIDQYRPLLRKDIIDKLSKNNVKYFKQDIKLSYDGYAEELSNFRFIISPPGNGIDAHRNWETLYLGSIPVVMNHLIYKDYNLPFLKVNDYSELTYKVLNNYLEFYHNHKFNYEPLTLSYWKNRMLEELKKL